MVLPMNIQNCFPLRLIALISLQSKGLPRVFSNTADQKHQLSAWLSAFFVVQLSHLCMTIGKIIALTRQIFVGKVICLLFNILSRLVIAFLPRSSSVQSLSHVPLFVTLWTAAHQASLSITNSWSLLKLMSIELVMPSNHLILCRLLLLPPSIFPSIRVFSNESVLRIRWPKYWSFNFNISPSNEHLGLISFRMNWHILSLIGLA